MSKTRTKTKRNPARQLNQHAPVHRDKSKDDEPFEICPVCGDPRGLDEVCCVDEWDEYDCEGMRVEDTF